MKIRIKGNFIRFRLTQSEVKQFCEAGHIEEETNFKSGDFTYGVRLTDNVNQLSAEFKENTITLYLPTELGKDWFNNDLVGFENTIQLNNGRKLELLLEKDFTCLDNTLEDQSDNYPNPKANS